MGLDVYFTNFTTNETDPVGWTDPILADFPFQKSTRTTTLYPEDVEYTGDWTPIGEETDEYIAEICGMPCIGGVSFRGRGYSDFASAIELPWSFYHDFTPAELNQQTKALGIYLEQFKDFPADHTLPEDNSLGSIRNLHKLLCWAVSHNLGTDASY